jgi:hypothetical protein
MAVSLYGQLHAWLWITIPSLTFLPLLAREPTERGRKCVFGRGGKMKVTLVYKLREEFS